MIMKLLPSVLLLKIIRIEEVKRLTFSNVIPNAWPIIQIPGVQDDEGKLKAKNHVS